MIENIARNGVPELMGEGMVGRPIFGRPVFIIACPRSGTSLLFETLAQSPDLWTIGQESHVVIEGIQKLQASRRGWDSNRLTAEDADPETVRLLTEGFVARLRNRDGQRPAAGAVGLRFLEKTPRNCLRVPFLAAAFPDAFFLHLYRDPRETISSMLDAWRSHRFVTFPNLPGWQGPPWSMLLVPGWRELAGKGLAEIVARQWSTATDQLLDDLTALSPDRWCVASYDRLISEPQAEIQRLCELIGVDWDRRLSAPLPLSRTILNSPETEKWRHNSEELAAVMPMIAETVQRARALAPAPSSKPRRRSSARKAPASVIEKQSPPQSLFVISLPRSLSSLTYHVARNVLGLAEPVWTSSGEVLNNDSYAMYGGPAHDEGRKFTRPAEETRVVGRLFAFLDQMVKPVGFAYKDVVQPFVVSQWLTAADRGLAVLRIRRPLVDVAMSMLSMRWLYPARSRTSPGSDELATAFLRGLLEAEAALDRVPAVEVEYDDLVRDEAGLRNALRKLAPGRALPEVRYVTAQFRRECEDKLVRRQGEDYQLMSEKLEAVRRAAASSSLIEIA